MHHISANLKHLLFYLTCMLNFKTYRNYTNIFILLELLHNNVNFIEINEFIFNENYIYYVKLFFYNYHIYIMN